MRNPDSMQTNSKKKPIAIICLLVFTSAVAVGLIAEFLFQSNEPVAQVASITPASTETKVTTTEVTVFETIPEEKTPVEVVSPDVPEPVLLTEEMAEQLSVISAAYVEEIHYPAYSQPLTKDAASYLSPNHFSEVEIPVLDGSQKAALSLNKYRHYYPDNVEITLKTSLPVERVVFELIEPTTRQPIAKQSVDGNKVTFKSKEDWPEEIRVRAKAWFSTGEDILTADFRFFVPVAYVESAGDPSAVGADLVIPLSLDVKKKGIYRIRANMFTTSGQAVAVLTARGKLDTGSDNIELKAHKSVLSGQEGPFELRDIQVEKMSGFPGEKASYGVSKQAAFPIDAFEISMLSDEPYQPTPEEIQRMQFLKNMSEQ